MGRKLGELAVHAVPDTPLLSAWLDRIASGTTPGTYPVGLAVLFAALGLPEDAAFATHQYGVATMLLGAALRLMKVSYLDAQQILFAVNMTTETTYRSSSCLTLEDMAAFAPVTDILAAAHVKASVRLFMN
jgi:urease accessory protein